MKNKLTQIGKLTTILSFLIGTLLFLILLNNNESILILQVGFVFVISAIIINSILFVVILFYAFKDYPYSQQLLITGGLMLINIPISAIYLYVIFEIFLGY